MSLRIALSLAGVVCLFSIRRGQLLLADREVIWKDAGMQEQLEIRNFRDGDEAAFRRLNEEWITRYFVLEPKDVSSFADPRSKILDAGGSIFLAVLGGQTVGCCALVSIGTGEFEVAKMAVTETAQGKGIGRALLTAVVDAAKRAGVKRLYIETNHVLTPAIRLYESLGFRHLPPERVIPSPYARADVFMEFHF